jgi:hypothetical protein
VNFLANATQDMLRCRWSTFVTRANQLRRRPLFVNLRSLIGRIPFRPFDINCLYFLEYVGIPPQHTNFIRGRAEIRSASLQDLEELTKCKNTPREFLERFKANDYCAVAVLDGRIVAHQWVCDRPFHIEQRYSYKIEIPPDAVYTYDLFILPEHRLSGMWFKFYSLYVRELMQRLHRQKIIGMVDYGSHLSMNTHLRFGFKLFRRVLVIKMFGKSLCLTRTFRSDTVALPRWVSIAGGAGAPGHAPLASSPTPAVGGSARPEPPAAQLPRQTESNHA